MGHDALEVPCFEEEESSAVSPWARRVPHLIGESLLSHGNLIEEVL